MNTKEMNETTREKNLQLAVECVSKAYNIDNNNSEIAVQHQELKQAYQDFLNERRVNEIHNDQTNQELMASISNLSVDVSRENNISNQDSTTKLLSALAAAEPSSLQNVETVATFAVLDRFKRCLVDIDPSTFALETLLVETVQHALETDKSAQVYLRTNEALSNLLRVVENYLSQLRDSVNQTMEPSKQSNFSSLIRILCAALIEERTSKVLLIESFTSILSSSIQLICRNDLHLDILDGLLSLITVLTASSSQKSRMTVLKSKELVLNLSGSVSRLTSLLCESALAHKLILLSCSILKDFVFSDDGKKSLLSQTGPQVLVPVLGSLLQYNQSLIDSPKKKKSAPKDFHQLIEVCVETLLGCSQCELLRPAFFDAINGDSDENQTHTPQRSVNTVQLLLTLCQKEEWAQANGLAVLMNITIQDDSALRQVIFENGALEVCLSVIKRNENAEGEYGRIRAIGLLSR
jgi:hypothetical protein